MVAYETWVPIYQATRSRIPEDINRDATCREHVTFNVVQGSSNMTGTNLYVNKPHRAAAVRP
jgi:hypothetical protein